MALENCWKCKKPTKSHHDQTMVYTPYGARIYTFATCHECWEGLEENELTEFKKKVRDAFKAEAMKRYEAEHANDEKPKRIIQDKIRITPRW